MEDSDLDPPEDMFSLDSADSSDDLDRKGKSDAAFTLNLNTTEEDDGVGPSAPQMRQFAEGITYRKLDCNSILVCLEPFQKLHFCGKVVIRVLKGKVNVFGFTFGPDGNKYCAFSARGHSSLLSITAIPSDDDGDEDVSDTGHPNISLDEFQASPGVLMIMEGFENEWCDGFRHVYPDASNFIGPSITGIGPGKLPKLSIFMDKLGFQFVRPSKGVKLLDFPPYFDQIFDDLIQKYDSSCGRICPFGGQGVGKSTFVKWLTNRFLSTQETKKVLFLDLDPGQSEFTPPGMLSVHLCSEPILGPNFSHLKDPIRAVFLGGVNMADVPVSYVKGVAELVEFCSTNEDFKGIPWIVNTMGFSQGLGVHLACEIIKIVRPNCVIQIQINNDGRSFPFLLNKANVADHNTFLSSHLPDKFRAPLEEYPFLAVKSACNRDITSNNSGWGLDRKKTRKLTLIAYFAEKVGSSDGFSLQSIIPLTVPLNSIAIGTINSALSYDDVIATLNGNLVALCAMPDSAFHSHDESKKLVTKAGNYSNNCFGYGLVRAYEKKSDTLFIITPLQDSEVLQKVNVILAAGAIGIPVNFYIPTGKTHANDNSGLRYVMSRKEGTSTLHTPAKKFFVPKRVTHSVLKNCLL